MATVLVSPEVPGPGDERMKKGVAGLTAHAWELISACRDVKYSSFERTSDGLFFSRGKPYYFHMHILQSIGGVKIEIKLN